MALPYVSEEEKAVVDATLWLANRREIRSTEEVERRFAKLPLVPGVFRTIESGAVEKYEGDQRELKRWLDQIVGEFRTQDREAVIREVNKTLANTLDYAGAQLEKGRLRYFFGLTGVQAVRAFGVAVILDKKRGLTDRLQECPACGRFRLDWNLKGRPRKVCDNPRCKRKFEASRVKDWRNKPENKKPSLKDE